MKLGKLFRVNGNANYRASYRRINYLVFGNNCTKIKPFKFLEKQSATITVTKIYWQKGKQEFTDICEGKSDFEAFDVRDREEDAFNCLKAKPLICKTTLNGNAATVAVIPASWIRNWKPLPVRDHHFHAYISQDKDQNYNFDLYSRQLSEKLTRQNLILESALKSGPKNPIEGFLVRVKLE